MLKYCIKRLALSLLILFGVSVIIYVLVRMMPTSHIDNLLQSIATTGGDYEKRKAELYAYYGLEENPTF